MDKDTAVALINDFRIILDGFNRLSANSMAIEEDELRKTFRRALAKLMIDCDDELIRLITARFPELDPVTDA